MKLRIVIVGSGGRLGTALMADYRERYDAVGFSHAKIDIGDYDEVEQFLKFLDFDLLINCAAMTNVDLCEEQPDEAFRVNSGAPGLMAEICARKNARMIHFSTDYVFDGKKNEPYNEKDEAKPLSVYGESKLEGEEAVLAIDDQNLVVRVSWVFGPERSSFIDHMIKRARDIELVEAVADKFSTPTYTRDISQMLHPMLESLAARNDSDAGQDSTHVYHGVLHFANSGACSWQEYAQYGLDCCHQLGIPLKASKVRPIHLADMTNWVARRPVHSVLSTAKYSSLAGTPPRSWREALAQYIASFYFSLKDSRA